MPMGCRRGALAPDGHRRAMAERRMEAALVGEGEGPADGGAGKRRPVRREPQSLPSYLKDTLSLVR